MELAEDAKAQAEMEAAFNATSINEAEQFAQVVEEPKVVNQEVGQNQEEVKVDEKKEEEPPKDVKETIPPSLSEDQLRLLAAIPELEKRLTRQVDKVAGNYGEVKKMLEEIKQASATPQRAAEFVDNASDDEDEILGEFTPSIKRIVNDAVSKLPQGASQEQIDKFVADKIHAAKMAEREESVQILADLHPDYEDVIYTKNQNGEFVADENGIRTWRPEYQEWMKTLKPSTLRRIDKSTDPYFVAEIIDQYKEWRTKQAETQAKQAEQAEKSKKRIESAVTPQGARPPSQSTLSEEEEMLQGFASAKI